MAARAKKKITTTTEELDDDVEAEEKEKLDDETIRALAEMEGASEIRWQVHRLGGTNPGFCQPAMTTPELTLENIARRHGAGNYRIRGVKSDGQYFKSATITIAETTAPTTPDLSSLLKDLKKDDNSLMPLLIGMMQSNASIVAAALSKPDKPEKEFPWKEIIVASPLVLTGIKEFFARKDESNDAMERLLKQLTLVEKLRGDDNKGSTWTDILRDALPTLQGLASRAVPAGSGVPVATRAPSNASSQLSAPSIATANVIVETPEAVAPPVELQARDFFTAKFEELLRNAADDKDPELRAEVFIDDLPSYIPESTILEMLSAADWFERLCLFDTRVANYRGWFTNLREYILHAVQNADDDDPPIRNDETEPEVVRS